MHYSNRPSYVQASYFNQRLHPYQDPTEIIPEIVPPLNHEEPSLPPPSYDPRRSRQSPAAIISARSVTTTIEWKFHPAEFTWNWKRILRIPLYFQTGREEFKDSWPVEFGGKRAVNSRTREEDVEAGEARELRAISSVSEVDSSINLTHTRTGSSGSFLPIHPLEPLFAARIHQLNTVVADHLQGTRTVMMGLEIIDISFLIILIVALIVTKGAQQGFLTGVEVSLVMVILLNAGLYSQVRVKRWSLQKELRSLARDWSPLPVTSSTNAGLLNNYFGGEETREQIETREKASLRWSIRQYEGSYWTSYRPVCKVELVTPARVRSSHVRTPTLDSVHRVPVPPVEQVNSSEAVDAPAYEV